MISSQWPLYVKIMLLDTLRGRKSFISGLLSCLEFVVGKFDLFRAARNPGLSKNDKADTVGTTW